MTEARLIRSADGEDLVQLPRAAFEALVDQLDMLISARAGDRVASGAETAIAAEDVEAYLAAVTPLAYWRAKRGLTLEALADRAGIAAETLDRLEQGHDPLDVHLASRLSRALSIATDDLARA